MKQTKNNVLSLLGIIAGIFAVAFVTVSCKTEISIPTHTVTYSSAHGSVPEAISVEENMALSEDQLPVLSDDNASFAGWYLGTSKVEPGYVVNADLALTARWEFTVTYSSQYGTAPSAINVEENSVLSAEQLPELSDDAAVFKGWYAGDTKAVPGEYQVTNNVTLTARWSQLATITYHSKFGTVPESFELERNQTLAS
ncbi:MAG: InlB B-repeat-containing protein, partial [Treponema sp.]|nr:InlB B-repeat-containing protein [Treponema sp.]